MLSSLISKNIYYISLYGNILIVLAIGPIKCKHAAPEEAPPPIPVESYDGITSTCALSLTGETIYAEPHIGG